MENNEIMNYEDIEAVDSNVEVCEDTGIGTGLAILIGAGIAAAIGGGVALAKKGIAKLKAKKELKKPDKEISAEDLEADGVVNAK